MNKATLNNLLPNAKIRLNDGKEVLLVSLFYEHPLMLDEDGWTLVKIGSENILIDKDTMQVIDKCEIELQWEKDHIQAIQLTSDLTGDDLKKHWEQLIEFSRKVKNEMSEFFHKEKVDDLCNKLTDVTIVSDSSQGDETPVQKLHEHETAQKAT